MRVDVGDGRDADAWRLDDVHNVDADAGTGAAASFLGMWVVMMVAMMLPSLVPMRGATVRPSAKEERRGSVG
ncbi:DUF2182 domain-containing protein [Mesorhizobium temperatum]|uniref:copper chaperone n=1 Tax=Mesorhizobium temperatum TaxID=241416 RepID=UPI00197DE1C9|nr:DUF2182 domain-containing protein [Mesorhizobium temperatum]